jgi:hypothetical protein
VRRLAAALAGLLLLAALAQSQPMPAPPAPRRYLPAPPKKLTLCGEPVPLELPHVAEALDREFTIAVHDQAQVVMWLKRARRYFPYITRRLKAAGLPEDLKYLCVAESSLLRRIRSRAGAVGLWQLVPGTARRYGLRVNRWFDDRRNVEKATGAALAYLKDLYAEFGSWALAMAAYNCGEKRLRREVAEQGVKDYYHLYLPRETMRYLFRIMAAKIILSRPAAYGYVLPPEHLYRPRPSRKVTLVNRRPLHLRLLAAACGSTVRELMELNPELRTYWLPAGKVTLQVPPGGAKDLAARLAALRRQAGPAPSSPPGRPRTVVVRTGDTLSAIARRHGVKLEALRRANRITGSLIRPGQRLVIP